MSETSKPCPFCEFDDIKKGWCAKRGMDAAHKVTGRAAPAAKVRWTDGFGPRRPKKG